MTREDHTQIKDLVAAYVLGALPLSEQSLVRDHILACDECMAEADAFSETASGLALVVDEKPLPPGFTDRVVAAATAGAVTPRPERRRSFLPLLAGAAALLLVGFLSVSLLEARRDLRRNERALAALARGSDGIELSGEGNAGGRVIPSSEGGYFIAAGLPSAPEGHTYQLWVIRGDEPVSAGLFEAPNGIVIVETATSLDGADAVAVTLEPDGGSPGPTTEPVLISSG